MRVSLSANAAQSKQVKERLANPEESLSYELGKAVQELPPLYTRLVAGSISFLVFGAIAWAHLSQVEEVATSTGKLVPSTEVRPLRAVSVGTVTRINFKTGSQVKEGDVLVEIDPGASETNVESLEQDARKIQEDIARLEAEARGQGATGNSLQDALLSSRQREFNDKQAAAVAEANRQSSTIAEAQSRLERFQENLQNGYATLANAKASRQDAVKNLSIAKERLRRLKTLENTGAVPHLELLNADQQVSQANQQVISASNQITDAENQIVSLQKEIEGQRERIQQARQAYESAKNTASGLAPQRQAEILTQIKQRREELTRKQGEISVAQQQRKDREKITAPFDGIVYNQKVTEGPVDRKSVV